MAKQPTPEDILRQMNGTIRFWESRLLDRGLLSISTAALIELTLEDLKELRSFKFPSGWEVSDGHS